jgi:Ca2+-binding RTX toxin-like protein
MAIIKGNAKNNILKGTILNDTIFGYAGDDNLTGLAGNDTLRGGDGEDKLFGGKGNDKLFGGNNFDKLFGGDGIDKLNGGDDFGLLDGGKGNDVMSVGFAGWGYFRGGAGKDVMTGGDNAFRQDIFLGGAGADVMNGGGGFDLAVYTDSATGVTVDLAGTIANAGDVALGDILFNIEGLVGSFARDVLAGSVGSNGIAGNGGNDIIGGLEGDDFLIGGSGDDTLVGGAGRDFLTGDGHNGVPTQFGLDFSALFSSFASSGDGVIPVSGGRDVFRLAQIAHSPQGSNNRDLIFDFEQGLDKIDLSAIPGIRTNYFFDGLQPQLPNPFVVDPNTGFGGSFSFYHSSNSTIIQGISPSGPGGGQVFEIEIANVNLTLTLADFII